MKPDLLFFSTMQKSSENRTNFRTENQFLDFSYSQENPIYRFALADKLFAR